MLRLGWTVVEVLKGMIDEVMFCTVKKKDTLMMIE